ncbi:methyltransferase family protein [Gymnodinialimonas ulvae]|uniref:methyltransferase family protein n=1 Tax=Gymnodinialimonas ulvae TaxID=3126504 RepID=UPI0030A7019C
MKGFPDLPPLWLLLFMVAAWVLARFVPLSDSIDPLLQRFGVMVAGLGFVLIFWAAAWFWKKKTTIEPHHTPGTLIVEGPFRLSRNPIYLGMILILSGQVIWLSALSPVILIPALLLLFTRRFVLPEEAALVESFGAEGRAYIDATRRWL